MSAIGGLRFRITVYVCHYIVGRSQQPNEPRRRVVELDNLRLITSILVPLDITAACCLSTGHSQLLVHISCFASTDVSGRLLVNKLAYTPHRLTFMQLQVEYSVIVVKRLTCFQLILISSQTVRIFTRICWKHVTRFTTTTETTRSCLMQ